MTTAATEGRVKIVVKLERDEDGYPPADYEGLWALPVGDGLFRIDNVPFFARGIAWGDIVSATVEQQELRFIHVVRASGHSTLRLIIHDAKELPSVSWFLEQQGCAIERSHIPGLISVDVPPAASIDSLRKTLDEGEAQDRWGYEEACLAST